MAFQIVACLPATALGIFPKLQFVAPLSTYLSSTIPLETSEANSHVPLFTVCPYYLPLASGFFHGRRQRRIISLIEKDNDEHQLVSKIYESTTKEVSGLYSRQTNQNHITSTKTATMGTYLSTPVLDKHTETGSDLNDATPVQWAVVDMQGWRKSMEDAHVARTDVLVALANHCRTSGGAGGKDAAANSGGGETNGADDANTAAAMNDLHAKVFAVFDGHGGPEVARYCQMHLVDVLTSQDGWKEMVKKAASGKLSSSSSIDNGTTGSALDNDALLTAAAEAAVNGETNADGNDTNNDIASNIAQALIDSFHALDRLIDDPSQRDEIEKWRVDRPPPYVSAASSVSTNNNHGTSAAATENGTMDDVNGTQDTMSNATNPTQKEDVPTPTAQNAHLIGDHEDYDSDDSSKVCGGGGEEGQDVTQKGDDGLEMEEEVTGENGVVAAKDEEIRDTKTDGNDAAKNITSDAYEEEEAVTKEESFGTDDSDLDDDENNGDGVVHDDSDDEKESETNTTTKVITANDAISLFQKLLHINKKVSMEDEDDDGEMDGTIDGSTLMVNGEPIDTATCTGEEEKSNIVIPTQEELLNPPTGIVAPSASVPTKIQNGRKVCNLPDHPVHAGCTSVVAVIVDKTLVVANAGDSRAVICRAGGLTEPLSFDHKPLQVSLCCLC